MIAAILAHAGHWAVDLGIYVGPILVIGSGLLIADRLEKRRRARESDESDDDDRDGPRPGTPRKGPW